MSTKRLGIIGARGYAGGELIGLLADHAGLELVFVSSRELDGDRVADHVDAWAAAGRADLRYEALEPAAAADYGADAVVLALPNGLSERFAGPLLDARADTVLVDLSSDHRFDDSWTYGQPERCRDQVRQATRIANPGCYATGMQLGLWPIADLLDGPPQIFGVSGYSGAGTSPSPKNDVELLRDNLVPYGLTDHTHEREVSAQLDRQVFFTPHVAPFFRGITLTISAGLRDGVDHQTVAGRYAARYADEPLVGVQDEVPLVRDAAGRHEVTIGGLSVDERLRRAVVVVTLDNLLKGAATQALQNLNLTCGFDELEGIR